MTPSDSIEVRKYRADVDKAYVYSTWLRNYKYSSYFAKRIKHVIFFGGHQSVIDHLLKKPTITVLIACPKGDPETILGYLAYENLKDDTRPVVHFTFVKDAFRNMGVARSLFKYAEIDPNKIHFTHWTFLIDDLIQRWDGMIYDPYKL